MTPIKFSPEGTNKIFDQLSIKLSEIRTEIERERRLANELVLTRNMELGRLTLFQTADIESIINSAGCKYIRLTHVRVKKVSDSKYYSSLLAIGQDVDELEMDTAPIFVGTPGGTETQGTLIQISKNKLVFTKSVSTGITWENSLPTISKNLHTWLQTAFHDQKPVFLPLLARFDKDNDWPLFSGTPWIAFAPAIFQCTVTDTNLQSPSGWYCTYIVIALDQNKKPVEQKFYMISDMWRPNYPVTLSYSDDASGMLPPTAPRYLLEPDPENPVDAE